MDEPELADRWYVVQCKPQQQLRALSHLTNQAFQCFNPSHPVQRRRRRRLEIRDEPLFPGYLFIRLGPQTNWRSLMSTRGVLRVVSFNGRFVPVCDEVVEALWQRCYNEVVAEPQFRPGQRVVVTEGCFQHVEAIVKATRGDERVVLLMNLMCSLRQIEVPAVQLALA